MANELPNVVKRWSITLEGLGQRSVRRAIVCWNECATFSMAHNRTTRQRCVPNKEREVIGQRPLLKQRVPTAQHGLVNCWM